MTSDRPPGNVLPSTGWQRDGLRFIVFGLLNTAVTYGIYCLAVIVLPAQVSYLIVYALGVVFAYFGNAKWVFQAEIKPRSALAYPLIQLIQYLVTATVLEVTLRYSGLGERLALAVAIALVTPLAFLMNRYIFRPRGSG